MTEPVEKKRRVARPLNAAQKAEAIALWKSGTVTLDDLAERFKKDRTTFLRLFKEEGVQKGETEAETKKKVEEAVEHAIVDDATVLATRIKDTKDEHYKMSAGLAKLTWNVIRQAAQEKRSPATYAGDMKALKDAAMTLKLVREERYAVLGINADDDNDDKPLPDLMIQELTAEDIKEMHRKSAQESDDDLGINEIGDATLGDEEALDDRVETD